MNNQTIEKIKQGQETAFINHTTLSNLAYKPQFISNNYREGRKVLSSIEDELLSCEQFSISVAFITMSGITPLLQTLKELENKGIPGRILTTDYLTFSEPKALDKLAQLKNIELKMYCANESGEGFHTKGYIFRSDEIYRMIVGSSNMTLSALTRNKEWNTKIISTVQGEYALQMVGEFQQLWDSEFSKNYEEFIRSYRTTYEVVKKQKAIARQEKIPSVEQYRLKPNKMQVGFIESLQKIRQAGEQRALLISATGTGKTYASAFALREADPKRVLFLVHREQIAKQAIESFRRVFGRTKTFGLLSGNSKRYDEEYLFATMQMMAKEETLSRYQKTEFDVIIIDEVHRAGASSYQRIMGYFEPQFWLGMTASPERTDGFDIYHLFDHNIAYEIRLQQALEEDLLCPFHYFGITEMEVDGEVFDDTIGMRNFSYLICDERVEYILEKAKYYGYSGDRVKGLMFCSRKEEAKELSKKFNEKGYQTAFLCGEHSQEERERCIERLTSDDSTDYLDYIFTIDIFNEGVDIPEINQVIMLRPTESPVVFIQQLGRGLRKADGKKYVVILDFIGNYMNNFMIPVALSGDRSYNKDNMRKYVSGGTKIIPGSSSIHFDEIARKRIYTSIDLAKTNDMKLLRDSYKNLKYKLGRIPSIQDFGEHGSIDVNKIFEKCGSYYAFLVKYEKEYSIRLSPDEEQMIEYLSRKVVKGKRVHELEVLRGLIRQQNRILNYWRGRMKQLYEIQPSEKEEESVILNLTNEFPKEEEKKKFKNCIFLQKDGYEEYRIAPEFQKLLANPEFFQMVDELLDYGICQYEENYADRYKETNFQLYQKYTYEDVCRLLNWKKNMNAQNIGGYFYDIETKTLPVFINYEKAEDAIAYEDRFVSSSELIALSKHPRKITSSDAERIYKKGIENADNKIYLFVRKNKDDKEAKEFYFLGDSNFAHRF
jgi:superfamily II DNA or RNA helicase/HKD family nuclease